jgi:anti-sigma-K factor RskA
LKNQGLARHSKTAWRSVAALLYAVSLVLIAFSLPAALTVLLAALLCFPEPRDALWMRTGIRLGGVATAMLAMTLVVVALTLAGWLGDSPAAGAGGVAEVVVVSDSLARNP